MINLRNTLVDKNFIASKKKINHLIYFDDRKLLAKRKKNWKPQYR